ncbi:hypothetical protein Tco_0876092 [Tanacetum coccineum]|uniref:Uncharacterized protein n=1 Tax=Tanacetum coccineum TaxID=301880 RepID=A0ABQ5BU52_9ASTR
MLLVNRSIQPDTSLSSTRRTFPPISTITTANSRGYYTTSNHGTTFTPTPASSSSFSSSSSTTTSHLPTTRGVRLESGRQPGLWVQVDLKKGVSGCCGSQPDALGFDSKGRRIFIESTNVIIQTTPRGRSLVSIAVYYEVTPHLVFRCVYGAATLGRGRGKGYMSNGGLENAPKKKKIDEVPIRKRAITFANNLLEDPDQGLELDASINLEENRQREKERRLKAKHKPLVLDKEVSKEIGEAYNAKLKFKLEVVERITPDAQLLLDLKQG